MAGMMSTTIAYAVFDGVTSRGEKENYSTQRVKFNSSTYG